MVEDSFWSMILVLFILPVVKTHVRGRPTCSPRLLSWVGFKLDISLEAIGFAWLVQEETKPGEKMKNSNYDWLDLASNEARGSFFFCRQNRGPFILVCRCKSSRKKGKLSRTSSLPLFPWDCRGSVRCTDDFMHTLRGFCMQSSYNDNTKLARRATTGHCSVLPDDRHY